MSFEYSEDNLIEAATKEVLKELRWKVVYAWHKETFGSNGLLGRENKSEVILKRHLLQALENLNPDLPSLAYKNALDQILEKTANKNLVQTNKEKYLLLTQGVLVSFQNKNGELVKKRLKVFNFEDPYDNEFIAVRQLEIAGDLYNRRPDIVGFVNGIPLLVFELKAHHTDLASAYTDNLTDYKDTIKNLFNYNAFILLSNGTDSKVGTITSPYKFFLDWKRIEENDEGIVSLDTILRGTCSPYHLLDIFQNFLIFDGDSSDLTKLMAKNHQYLGVNKVISKVNNLEDLKGKLGVFWHTQGAGKSYSMVFLCQKLLRKMGKSITFLIVVDRTELENQLYETFSGTGALKEENVRANSREHLKELLSENHRYVFTLIHKFSVDQKMEDEYPLITDRSNIIVISDEAHRTQGGKFAQNMRFNAIPNASYLGFTGTPIIKQDLSITKNIFGEYISIYDFKKAIQDNATLPLRYLNRGEKLNIENPQLDNMMAEIIENEDLDNDQISKLRREFARDYPILTSEKRLNAIAKDLVWHFNERGYQGKAMFVALDKPTAIRIYDLIEKYWPEYIKELNIKLEKTKDQQEAIKIKRDLKRVNETEVCVVVSSEQNEISKFQKMSLDIEKHRKKMVERDLEKEFKDDNNPFRLVIVCSMWITGFDVPSVSTMYLDKPLKGHTLMQTIARANRVYDEEKENGLIVDYGNVYRKLEEAYVVYGEGEKDNSNSINDPNEVDHNPTKKLQDLADEINQSINQIITFLKEIEFDLFMLINSKSPIEKISLINKAMNCICLNDKKRTEFEFMAREIFRKYKSLYPEPEIKKFKRSYNAIEAIYSQLNQKVKSADITEVILKLQKEVNISVSIDKSSIDNTNYVDLSNLNFEKLSEAFNKSNNKNIIVFDIKNAIESKLERMLNQNPIRLEFYERYKIIIDEYNQGKDFQAVEKAFEELKEFIKSLTEEEGRALKEGLDEETLAIFDLLKKPNLSIKEEAEVKKVSIQTLNSLKKEKLKINRWWESTQITSQIKTIIRDRLEWLPQKAYPDEELKNCANVLYQHIFTNYRVYKRDLLSLS